MSIMVKLAAAMVCLVVLATIFGGSNGSGVDQDCMRRKIALAKAYHGLNGVEGQQFAAEMCKIERDLRNR